MMRPKVKRSYTRNVQNKKTNNDGAKHFTNFQIFTSELFKDNVSIVENDVRKVLNVKNNSISELKEQLKECNIILRKRDDQINILDNEKKVFNQIMYAQVEKFDGTYQNKIDKLEAEKQSLTNQISDQESKLRYYAKHLAEDESKTNNKDDAKIRKIVKKCKDWKVKVKARDFELFQKELEKKVLEKHIDLKDDEIKKRDMEILDLNKKFNKINADIEEELMKENLKKEEMKAKAVKDDEAIEVMRKHSDVLNEELRKLSSDTEAKDELIKMKDIAILDINQRFKEEQSKCFSLDERNKMKDVELAELKSRIEKHEDLEISMAERIEELTETKRVQVSEMNKIKLEQISLDEWYKKVLEEKDEKIKSLAERNNLMCKDLLRKQQESAKQLLETNNLEISTLKDELEKRVKKEQILMKIIKSKELLIRTLEEKTESKVLTNKKHEKENKISDENQQNYEKPQNDEDLISKQHPADLNLKPNLLIQSQVEGTDWIWYGKEYLRNNRISITEKSNSL